MITKYPPSIGTISRYDGTATASVTKTHELDLKQVELLRRFKDKGWLEFRHHRYDDVTEGREVDLCYEMVEMELIESDGMSWHLTFRLTDIGKTVLSQLL